MLKYPMVLALSASLLSCSTGPSRTLSAQGVLGEAPEMPVQYQAHGFSLSPGRSCEGGWIDLSFCAATEPKDWSAAEFRRIETWLTDLPEPFLDKVRESGFGTFYRYTYGFQKVGAGYERKLVGAWVWGEDKSINFSEMFFVDGLRDPLSGFNLAQTYFVHELAHAYGVSAGQSLEELKTVLGWSLVDGQWQLASHDVEEAREVYKRVREMALEAIRSQNPDLLREAITLNRSYGVSRGFPTAYSMTDPEESLAEMLAFAFMDPDFDSYANPSASAWIAARVFPEWKVISDLKRFEREQREIRSEFDQESWSPSDRQWVREFLAHRVKVDQHMRGHLNVIHENSYTAEETAFFWRTFSGRWKNVDVSNTAALGRLLEHYHWLTISEFGEETDRNAWLLAQHADWDLAFQKMVLERLSGLYTSGETSAQNFAYLYDRVAMHEERPQRYGTQGQCAEPGRWEPFPIEDPESVDARRREVGLATLAEYRERLNKVCH